MNTLDKVSIYDGISQLLPHIGPEDIRPIASRVLIRDAHSDEQVEGFSVILKLGESEKDRRRIGIVVAVGQGDRTTQWWSSIEQRAVWGALKEGLESLPMSVKPGDKVLYDRRRDFEFQLADGIRYSLVYEEQSILGVFDE